MIVDFARHRVDAVSRPNKPFMTRAWTLPSNLMTTSAASSGRPIAAGYGADGRRGARYGHRRAAWWCPVHHLYMSPGDLSVLEQFQEKVLNARRFFHSDTRRCFRGCSVRTQDGVAD